MPKPTDETSTVRLCRAYSSMQAHTSLTPRVAATRIQNKAMKNTTKSKTKRWSRRWLSRRVSRSILHSLGYRKNIDGDYVKVRRNKVRRENNVTVIIEWHGGHAIGMQSKEDGYHPETTGMPYTVEDVIEWERFAFCG